MPVEAPAYHYDHRDAFVDREREDATTRAGGERRTRELLDDLIQRFE